MKESFWKGRSGMLTISFLVIVAAFVMIMVGLGTDQPVLYGAGFILIVCAMTYSPICKFVLKKQ